MHGRYISFIGLALFFALFLLIVVTAPEAEAVVEYTNNDDSDNAIWIETPVSMEEVHMWTRWGSNDNEEDWWMFNASAGKDVQINYRKYDNYDDPQPPFLGGTFQTNYRVYDAFLREIYRYSYTYDNPITDHHRRDSWSYIVPENEGGKFYLRIFITTGQSREAYYWLNITAEDPRDLNAASQYDGVLDINTSYTADFDPVDYFTVDLNEGDPTSDFVILDFNKEDADADLILEVWETIPFGFGEKSHMLNRTTNEVALNLQVRFLATNTGTYTVRMMRDFFDAGSSNYTLTITFLTRPRDVDGLAENGTEINHVQKLRDQTIEMGYDTHDWYKVQLLENDTIFKVIVDINDDNFDGQGYELVVYNEAGNVRWVGSSTRTGPTYDDTITVPPPGTTTIFDKDETYYVRFSANASITDRTIKGFRSLYDIEFVLTNRAPQLIVPFNETYEWDEDGGLSLFLDAHFFDPDGDKMDYFLMNRPTGWSYDVPGLTYWGWFNVSSPPEWSGQETWTLKAQDEGQTSDDHKIFIDFIFIVHSVPDLPISNGTLYRVCDEESSSTANLNKLFYDMDDGPEGVLTFGYPDTGITNIQVNLDTETGAVEFIPDPDVFGDFTFEFFCHDVSGEHIAGTVDLKVVGINDIPRIVAPIDIVYMDEGGDEVEVDMDLYFIDVDGEDLRYTFLVPSSESGVINVYHKNNVITEHWVVIDLTDDGFYGTVLVNVTCKDEQNTLVKQDMLIIVSNVPDSPSIDYFPLGNPSAIEETGSITFMVTDVLDADLPEFGLHKYTWFLDDVEIADHNESEYTYSSSFDDAGPHEVKVIVTDPSGLTAVQEPVWTFQVTNKNRVPTVSITTPPDTADEGKKVTLTAAGTDEDMDELTYTWYLVGGAEDKVLGTGKTIETKDLKAGNRLVGVEVEDGNGGTASDSHTIKVEAVEETSGMGMWLGIIIVVVIAIVVALVVMMKRGKPDAQPEAGMDIESLQQEYDPTQGRGGTEPGKTYDSSQGDWESLEER